MITVNFMDFIYSFFILLNLTIVMATAEWVMNLITVMWSITYGL